MMGRALATARAGGEVGASRPPRPTGRLILPCSGIGNGFEIVRVGGAGVAAAEDFDVEGAAFLFLLWLMQREQPHPMVDGIERDQAARMKLRLIFFKDLDQRITDDFRYGA